MGWSLASYLPGLDIRAAPPAPPHLPWPQYDGSWADNLAVAVAGAPSSANVQIFLGTDGGWFTQG